MLSWYCIYILCDYYPILFIPNLIVHCILAIMNYQYAIIRLKSYQLSHIYLGDHFQWKGNKWFYTKQRSRFFILSLLSFGYFYPDYLLFHYSYLIQNLSLNDKRFTFSFDSDQWDASFFDHTAKSFFSFGLYKIYAELKLLVLLIQHMHWGDYQFRLTSTQITPSFKGFLASFFNILTLGIFYPFYMHYKMTLLFSFRRLELIKRL